MPMVRTTQDELERFGKLWDAWNSPKKPTRDWFSWWCVGKPDVPDDQKITEFLKELNIN